MQLPNNRTGAAYYLNVSHNAVETSAYEPAIRVKHSNEPVSRGFNRRPYAHPEPPTTHANAPTYSDQSFNLHPTERPYVCLGRRLVRFSKRLTGLRI